MSEYLVLSVFNMQIINGCLIVPVNGDLDDDYVCKLQKNILEKVKATCLKEVIIDVSAVKIVDSFTFSSFKSIAQMVTILGARVVFVGFQPGVASSLVDLDVELGGMLTAVTMEDGFELLRSGNPVDMLTDETESTKTTEAAGSIGLGDKIESVDNSFEPLLTC